MSYISISLSIHTYTHTPHASNHIGVAAVVIECYNIVNASLLWRNVDCENMGEKITIKFVNVRPFVRSSVRLPSRSIACARSSSFARTHIHRTTNIKWRTTFAISCKFNIQTYVENDKSGLPPRTTQPNQNRNKMNETHKKKHEQKI